MLTLNSLSSKYSVVAFRTMSGFSLTARQLVQAKEAIEMLSSLSSAERPGTSGVGRASSATSSTSTLSTTQANLGTPQPSSSQTWMGSEARAEVMSAANRCLNQLKLNGDRVGRRRKAKEEVSSLFGKRKKIVKCVWKHKFICLASCNQQRIPTTDEEKDKLFMAGLGEKEIEFTDLELSAGEFRDLLYHHFPSLKEGGGYQFFKCVANSRSLERLSSTTLSSPSMLKSRVGNSRTYIRPIQKNLDLTPIIELPGGATEQCLRCGELYSLEELSSHLDVCGENSRGNEVTDGGDIDTIDLTENADSPGSFQNVEDDSDLPPGPAHSYLSSLNYDDVDEIQSIEREMVGAAVGESLNSRRADMLDETIQNETVASLINKLQKLRNNIDYSSTLHIEVRRSFVVTDALSEARKRRFTPKKLIKVTFVGEGAIDHGGPTREFFRIFAEQVCSIYFRGEEGQPKFFRNDILGVQNNDFHILGVYTVLSILHGGTGLPFLAKPVFDYLSTGHYSAIVQETEIPDVSLRFLIKKINSAESDNDIQETFETDEAIDALYSTGYTKATTHLVLADRMNLLNILLDYHLMAKVKSEMDQFINALNTFGLLDHIKQNPVLWKPYFAPPSEQLTAESIKRLIQVKYSQQGSRFRPMEEQTYIFFRDFLDDCEENEVDCSVKDVLAFFSGSDSIPPCGFEGVTPTMIFLHSCGDLFPTASTCDLEFRLPAIYGEYQKFKDAMVLGLKGHDGFGGV